MSPIWYYSITLLIGSFAMILLGLLSQVRRRGAMELYFALFALASAIYSFGYAMEVTRTVPESIRLWSRIEYIGLPFIASFLLIFVIHVVSSGRKISRAVTIFPILMSITFLVVRQTNSLHQLYYSNQEFVDFGNFMLMTFDKELWYWLLVGYNFLCIAGAVVLIAIYLINAPRAYRRQASWLMLGVVIPTVPYIVYVTGILPYGVDIIPASLFLASITIFIAIYRHNLFALVPVGRDRLVETMADAVFVLDEFNRVADANPAARDAFSEEGSDPIGLDLSDAFHLLAGIGDEPSRVKSDDRIWEITRIPMNTIRGYEAGYLVVGHDVTERESLVSRLEKMAREDILTGLLNRHSWDIAVNIELNRLSRHGRFGSIIYVDLDHFKEVNDSHGHAAGDAVLTTVGRVLKEGVRRPDLVGRYGGEEFVLFLPESHPERAFDVAERLRIDLYEAVRADKAVEVTVTGSFGVAGTLINGTVRLEDLVSRADKAMYASKQAGRNKVTLDTD